jgi:5'-deoxynucleotidase YfbR-like HD superfamily hydrolase
MTFCRQTPDTLRRVFRWTHYPDLPLHERETVETHELSTVWLGGAMLAVEEAVGTHTLNGRRILLACSIHDTGEGKMGDIGFDVKNDPRVRALLRIIEREYVEKQFEHFPPDVKAAFLDAYTVEDEAGKTIDGDFFNAIERIGYMMFAVPQVRKGRMNFRKVFKNQHEPLLKLSAQFESVRRFYEPYREYVAGMLTDYNEFEAVVDDAA